MSYEWFTSFDAIPELQWEPLVPITRDKLLGHDAAPRVEVRELYDGTAYRSVEWLLPNGQRFSDDYGSDPAGVHWHKLDHERKDLTPRAVAKSISEVLALPGTRASYHFAMLGAWGSLHKIRRRDIPSFRWIEALCSADITMLEQGPELVFPEDHWTDQGGGYPVWPAIDQLGGMYQREGFLAAAVELEDRFIAMTGSPRGRGDDVLTRQRALLEEDGR